MVFLLLHSLLGEMVFSRDWVLILPMEEVCSATFLFMLRQYKRKHL